MKIQTRYEAWEGENLSELSSSPKWWGYFLCGVRGVQEEVPMMMITNMMITMTMIIMMMATMVMTMELLSQMVGIFSVWGFRGPRGGGDDDNHQHDDDHHHDDHDKNGHDHDNHDDDNFRWVRFQV